MSDEVPADLARLLAWDERPEPWTPGTHGLWTDPAVAPGMLAAHLDRDLDAASRRPETVAASVTWFSGYLRPGGRVLDLGCGPGLYARHLTGRGFAVTGVDLSSGSLAHASATVPGGRFVLGDYRTVDLPETFDAVLLIYLDLGTFSPADTELVLRRVRAWTAPGGVFVLDVATPLRRTAATGEVTWGIADGGFWAAEPHLWLSRTWRYDDESGSGGPTYLDQHVVITSEQTKVYRVWERCWSVEGITSALAAAGFEVVELRGDLTGAAFDEAGSTEIGIVARAGGR